METNDLVPSLALFTLLAVLAIGIAGYMLFKRKRANQHPMEKSPDGAIATIVREPGDQTPAPIGSTREQGGPPHTGL